MTAERCDVKRVVIRTDSSAAIGSGHLMRCLALAHYLRERNYEVIFVCGELGGNLAKRAADNGFELRMLPYDPSEKEAATYINQDSAKNMLSGLLSVLS